ncbi:MAG: hypothetical protein U1E90_05505 [Burkholderiaceae bacterium]
MARAPSPSSSRFSSAKLLRRPTNAAHRWPAALGVAPPPPTGASRSSRSRRRCGGSTPRVSGQGLRVLAVELPGARGVAQCDVRTKLLERVFVERVDAGRWRASSMRWSAAAPGQCLQRGLAPACVEALALGGQPLGKRRVGVVVEPFEQRAAAQRDGLRGLPGIELLLEGTQVGGHLPAQGMVAGLQLAGKIACLEHHVAQVAPRLGVAALGPQQRGQAVARHPLPGLHRQQRQQLKAPLRREGHRHRRADELGPPQQQEPRHDGNKPPWSGRHRARGPPRRRSGIPNPPSNMMSSGLRGALSTVKPLSARRPAIRGLPTMRRLRVWHSTL